MATHVLSSPSSCSQTAQSPQARAPQSLRHDPKRRRVSPQVGLPVFVLHSSTDKIKHNPRPAALGTVAMLGNVKTSVATGMEAAQGKGSRLRRQMSTIYQNWEQGNALFHSNAARIN